MKKVLISLTLGIALLAPGQLARCDESRPTDDRPRARRARIERPSLVDLARRFAPRLFEATRLPDALVAEPAPMPPPEPDDDTIDVCTPERVHCPIG
ncbi:MAG: hypothetical protein ACYDBY_11775 [Thermoanaerobaculia bacterium]